MKLCWTTIHVSDMGQSLHFYHEVLGLPVSSKNSSPSTDVVMLGDGETKLELLYEKGNKNERTNNFVSVGFTVKSLEETTEYLKNEGVDILTGPISPNPHIRFFFASDPDGCQVQFVQSL